MNRFVLPCGCTVIVSHRAGSAPFTCGGGGVPRAATDRDDSPWGVSLTRCPGGFRYEVTAEELTTVLYEARPLDPGGAA